MQVEINRNKDYRRRISKNYWPKSYLHTCVDTYMCRYTQILEGRLCPKNYIHTYNSILNRKTLHSASQASRSDLAMPRFLLSWRTERFASTNTMESNLL